MGVKWIGQHIWDFVSRFRSDVYLEDLSTTTETNILVVDSDGKVSKNTTTAGGDITAVTITTDSGGGSAASDTSGSADFSILGATGVGVTNSGTTITATAVPGEIDHDSLSNFVAAEHYRWDEDISGTATIHANNITDLHGAGVDGSANQLLTDDGDGTVTSEASLGYDGEIFTVQSSTTVRPKIQLVNSNTDAEAPVLAFAKLATGAPADTLGSIKFQGDDDANNATGYALIEGHIEAAADGGEGGKLTLGVATHDGEMQTGLTLVDGNAEDEIDATIGNGTASLTTVAGNLDIQGNTISTAGNIELATGGSGNITLDAGGNIYHEAHALQLQSGDDSAHYPLLLITNKT